MTQENSTQAVVVPTVEATLEAFRALDKKGRRAMIAGLKDRMMGSFLEGELVIAESYKQLVAAVTAPDAGTNPDLEMAVRWVTVRAMLENLEANMTDAARSIAVTADVNPELLARLEGTGTRRTAVSSDGAARSGSGEPKGCVKSHTVAALEHVGPNVWLTVADIVKFDSNGCGYTDTYRPSPGAVSNVLRADTKDMIEHRRANRLEVAERPNGRGGSVWSVRIKPTR